MTRTRLGVTGLAVVLVALLIGGVAVVGRPLWKQAHRQQFVAYFDNSNGIFAGDEIRVLGVPVGAIDRIEPQPDRAKISFWVDDTYKIPADVKAVIISPQLVTARAIQLTPVYTGGPPLADGAVIPQDRTAVPMEWNDMRAQLQRLAETLKPTQPGGISTLGAFLNTSADNLRGRGANIRQTIIELSEAFSALGDHSGDIFGIVKNLSTLVTALQSSSDLMADLNRNLAVITGVVANDPNEIGQAVADVNTTLGDVRSFISENRDPIATTSTKLASVSQALVDSLDDIKQLLHATPDVLANLSNAYQPAQAALSGALAANNFADPIGFICGAVQAASRLGGAQAAKLCVQYLAPIVKNRQYNYLPIGENLLVGAAARPNELTYSEDWMRPDFVPPAAQAPSATPPPPLAAEAPGTESPTSPAPAPSAVATDPAAGLPGLMVPAGAGS
jgi:phospholipid/cholesterol/gamma-HCH transport system substrate-binding protein